MTPLRNAALRAAARPAWRVAARSSQQPALRQRYTTAKDAVKSSSSLPWALSAIIVTVGGTYLALQPREPVHHDEHHSSDHESHEDSDESETIAEKASNLKDAASDKASDLKDAATEKKDQVKEAALDKKDQVKETVDEKTKRHQEELARIKANTIKGERAGESVKNHGIASEKNEHKIREGKFCDDEFDNHIQVHSEDPGKDFEKIKEKAKSG